MRKLKLLLLSLTFVALSSAAYAAGTASMASTASTAATPAATTTSSPADLIVPASGAAAQNFSPAQTKAIEKIIHDYLIANPQVIVDAVNVLQQQQQNAMVNKAQQAIVANAKQIFADQNSPVTGNANGSVVLVEFFDYQCPHCKDMAGAVTALSQKYPQLKVVYKEFPIFPNSDYIAKAALASQAQGKYQQFHTALMAAADPVSKDKVLEIAKTVGLNVAQLQKDMDNATYSTEINNTTQLADTLGLQGTPAFIVASHIDMNDPKAMKVTFVPGQVPQSALDSLIAEASK